MTPQQASQALNAKAQKLRQAQAKLQQDTAKAAISAGQKFTHGGYSQATLNAMGNPYSKARPNPPAPPGILNYQSGGIFNGWRTRVSGNTLILFNVAPEALFVDPKFQTSASKMMQRPVTSLIVAELNKTYKGMVRARVMEALQP